MDTRTFKKVERIGRILYIRDIPSIVIVDSRGIILHTKKMRIRFVYIKKRIRGSFIYRLIPVDKPLEHFRDFRLLTKRLHELKNSDFL